VTAKGHDGSGAHGRKVLLYVNVSSPSLVTRVKTK
jgi:hypothetical protein